MTLKGDTKTLTANVEPAHPIILMRLFPSTNTRVRTSSDPNDPTFRNINSFKVNTCLVKN